MQNIPNSAVILAIVLNGLIFIIYLILKNNGERGGLFNGAIFSNPIKLFRLAKRTENKGIKITYFSMVFAIPILTILFIFSAYNQMSEFKNRDECINQEYFINREWKGVVIEKFLDKKNHNSPNIKIQNGNGIETIQNGFLFYHNKNYEFIEVGDSISKIRGKLTVQLFNPKGVVELEPDFDCEK